MRLPSFDDLRLDTKSEKQTNYARDLFEKKKKEFFSNQELFNEEILDPKEDKAQVFDQEALRRGLLDAAQKNSAGEVIDRMKNVSSQQRTMQFAAQGKVPRNPKKRKMFESIQKDFDRKAKPPGKRVSKNGNVYYEYRRNRSDLPGRRL